MFLSEFRALYSRSPRPDDSHISSSTSRRPPASWLNPEPIKIREKEQRETASRAPPQVQVWGAQRHGGSSGLAGGQVPAPCPASLNTTQRPYTPLPTPAGPPLAQHPAGTQELFAGRLGQGRTRPRPEWPAVLSPAVGEAPAAVQGPALLLSDRSQASPKPPACQVEPGSPAPAPGKPAHLPRPRLPALRKLS